METQKPQERFTFVQAPISDFSVSEYVALGAAKRGDPKMVMSRSAMMEYSRCPARWIRGFREGDTDATDWGSLVDCLITCPESFSSQYAITPETYTADGPKKGDAPVEKPWNWNATVCKDWRKAHEEQGMKCIKPDEWDSAREAAARMAGDAELMKFIQCSKKQVFVLVKYIDPDSSIEVSIKCLLDLVPDPASAFGKSLGDLKTTNNAGKRKWARHVNDYNLDAQAALHMDCYNCAAKTNYTQFHHLVQESFEPYECGRRILSEEFLNIGRAKYLRALADYCYSLKSGFWPSYDDRDDARGNTINGWSITEPEPWMIGNPDDL